MECFLFFSNLLILAAIHVELYCVFVIYEDTHLSNAARNSVLNLTHMSFTEVLGKEVSLNCVMWSVRPFLSARLYLRLACFKRFALVIFCVDNISRKLRKSTFGNVSTAKIQNFPWAHFE